MTERVEYWVLTSLAFYAKLRTGKAIETEPTEKEKDNDQMTFQQALEIMVNGSDDSDGKYEAVMVVELAVKEASEYGDPDSSLQDWISAGQYKLTDTPESIAAEWDADRDE